MYRIIESDWRSAVFLNRGSIEPWCSTELSLGFGGNALIFSHFQGRNQGAAGHLILGGKLDVGIEVMTFLLFWSSPDFEREIRHLTVRPLGTG